MVDYKRFLQYSLDQWREWSETQHAGDDKQKKSLQDRESAMWVKNSGFEQNSALTGSQLGGGGWTNSSSTK